MGYPVATVQVNGAARMIDEYGFQFAPIAGVDHPRSIDDRYGVLHSEPTTRRHESDVPLGYGHGHTGWHRSPGSRLERCGLAGIKIDSGITRPGSFGGGKLGIQLHQRYVHGC